VALHPYIASGSEARVLAFDRWLHRPAIQANSNRSHGSCHARLCTIMLVGPTIGPRQV
jgi:hypothetical protein